jgi:two-component system CheB/CheR fusion protein
MAKKKIPPKVRKAPPKKRKADLGKDSGRPPRKRFQDTFPIVGIGASAGGLRALETFLKQMPADCGMAFIIVQHLDPHHESLMRSLLTKQTSMPVHDVKDGTAVEPGHVYIKPPNRDVIIRRRTLYLHEPKEKEGVRLPIDTFFTSLAEDQQEKAIAIILSGAGSDGSLGAKLIKGEGGLVIVQDQKEAQYARMPQSVIDAGLADFILPVEQMPKQLLQYAEHPFVVAKKSEAPTEKLDSDLPGILALVRSNTGHDFSQYKRSTIQRRVELIFNSSIFIIQ